MPSKKDNNLDYGLTEVLSNVQDSIKSKSKQAVKKIDLEKILLNSEIPRLVLTPEDLLEAADQVRAANDLKEPLLVTKDEEGSYLLVAGEKRWRVAKMSDLSRVSVVVLEEAPQEIVELAILGNIRIKDLTPFEEAFLYEILAKRYKFTHEAIAEKLGSSRVYVTNKIRLLRLPWEVKKALLAKEINEGQARALVALKDEVVALTAMKLMIKHKMSTRQAEKLVRQLGNKKVMKKKTPKVDKWLRGVEKNIGKRLGSPVMVQAMARGGKIQIRYNSDKDLLHILYLMGVEMPPREDKK